MTARRYQQALRHRDALGDDPPGGPGRRDFPVLWTQRDLPRYLRPSHGRCSCCGLAVAHRNRRRHVAACTRRKRQAPRRWHEWRWDMTHGQDDRPNPYDPNTTTTTGADTAPDRRA